MKSTMIKFFDQYVRVGYKPIPLFVNSKIPVENNWNQSWSIERWRPYFEKGNYNIGFLLGDVVDVEGDSVESNALILKLIGDVKRPSFQSYKSVHHLFINPDPDLTRIAKNGIEFRGNSHQSVVPPSVHKSGENYKWLKNITPIAPEMPDNLLNFYHELKSKCKAKVGVKRKRRIKKDHTRTQCKVCQNYFYIHKKRLTLEVVAFRELKSPWKCHGCRDFDIKELCRFIRSHSKSL